MKKQLHQLYQKQVEAWKENFVKDNGPDIEPSFLDPEGGVGPILLSHLDSKE